MMSGGKKFSIIIVGDNVYEKIWTYIVCMYVFVLHVHAVDMEKPMQSAVA